MDKKAYLNACHEGLSQAFDSKGEALLNNTGAVTTVTLKVEHVYNRYHEKDVETWIDVVIKTTCFAMEIEVK